MLEKDNIQSEREYENFLKHRNSNLEVAEFNIQFLGRSYLTLSSAAFALSFLILNKLIDSNLIAYIEILIISWIALVFNILINLYSYQKGSHEAYDEVKRQDKYFLENGTLDISKPKRNKIFDTKDYNFISFIIFSIGIISMCIFILLNLGQIDGKKTTPSAASTTKAITTSW